METRLLLSIVGNYRISQTEPEKCDSCHNAYWASIIVTMLDDECKSKRTMCIECILRERYYYQLLNEKYSDAEARAIAYEEPNPILDGLDVNKLIRHKHSYEKND